MLLPDAEVPLSNDAAKILKMCILEARGMKSNIADTEHVLLAILREMCIRDRSGRVQYFFIYQQQGTENQ